MLKTKTKEIARKNIIKVKTTRNEFFEAELLIDITSLETNTSKPLNLNEIFKSVLGIQDEIKHATTNEFFDFYSWPSIAPETIQGDS